MFLFPSGWWGLAVGFCYLSPVGGWDQETYGQPSKTTTLLYLGVSRYDSQDSRDPAQSSTTTLTLGRFTREEQEVAIEMPSIIRSPIVSRGPFSCLLRNFWSTDQLKQFCSQRVWEEAGDRKGPHEWLHTCLWRRCILRCIPSGLNWPCWGTFFLGKLYSRKIEF